jgi:hypothetical protein
VASQANDNRQTRPEYFNRALYSPLAGLRAVAAVIPRDLTDENSNRSISRCVPICSAFRR